MKQKIDNNPDFIFSSRAQGFCRHTLVGGDVVNTTKDRFFVGFFYIIPLNILLLYVLEHLI